MNDQQHKDPLLEWNRLNIENAEQNLVSAMFSSLISSSSVIDRFSLWLLAGTGATAALLITNADNILPVLSEAGFKLCGAFLVASGLLGFLAKFSAISCEIAYENDLKIRQAMLPILDKHAQDEDKIQEHAEQRGLDIKTEIDMQKVLQDFAKPFPFLARCIMWWYWNRNASNRQMAYIRPVKAYCRQCSSTTWQTLSFIGFVITGLVYATII
ncbi:MAG: hypothetical protein K9M54_01765 [Kiritimatiellales bacterium]|nr:hypothetical protein [Kiritimatiellales bacterium]MCF7863492.1 hypothetical protein [Kiritimatiellales bacterium]